MKRKSFGGDWTEDKLARLEKYLRAYTRIFESNVKAQFFRTVYVDGFASTGYRTATEKLPENAGLFEELGEPEVLEFYKGSARVALEIEPRFDEYLFIELDPERSAELRNLNTEYPDRLIKVENADANTYLRRWCKTTNWSRTRAVVFLDPFGMQVEWSLLEAIAATQAIDLWLLFPLGMAVNRLLTNIGPPPPAWANSLTKVLGTDAWLREFYPQTQDSTLFGDEELHGKDVDFDRLAAFFINRLRQLFPGVAGNPLPLRNSRNVPLFLLCFASANPKGAKTAIRIAQDILRI